VELLIAVMVAVSVGSLVMFFGQVMPTRSRVSKTRIAELGIGESSLSEGSMARARRRNRMRDLALFLGTRIERSEADTSLLRRRLENAGYRDPSAVPAYMGIRLGLTGALGFYGVVLAGAVGELTFLNLLIFVGAGALGGWSIPQFILSVRISRRQRELRRALPDALDLLVICVEAGLGLNQALIRVAAEMRHVSLTMATEISQANLEIRAGKPRDQALLALADRTGVDDLRSLATMLIQTERFGTSVADSLRTHADTMRSKRQQRAEEASAKTTIKMVFPLALCIFPALMIVILGPVVIQIFAVLSGISYGG
jgi:tight adherence protein C